MSPQPGRSDAEARASAADFEGDMRFRWDMWTWARLAAQSGRQVYFYRFSRAPPFPKGDMYFGLGATHGMEMPYVFDHLDQQPVAWTSQDRALAATLSDYWVNFAKTANPNGPGLPYWPDFKSSPREVMNLGDTIDAQPITNLEQLEKIDRIYVGVRFASRNRYALLALTAMMVIGAVTALVLGIRRWRRRRLNLIP
jgi:para-nitrobenzyl esterase